MTGLLITRGNLETNMHTGRTSSEDESRDQGDASTNQGRPKTAINYQKLGQTHDTGCPSHCQKEPTLPTP